MATRTTTSVLAFMNAQIKQLQQNNRFGTALNYRKTMLSFTQYLAGKEINFNKITDNLIQNYNAYLLQRGMTRNTTSFYMRTLRAIYNKAVKQKLTSQTFPFSEVYTGIDRTRKRAIDEKTISQLFKLQLTPNSPLALARDLFIFSYCTRGMAFADMAYLKKSSLYNGYISYSRRKTGQLLTIKAEPIIEEIIARYNNSSTPYLFPIITSTNPQIAYAQYQQGINVYNRHLGTLSKMLSSCTKLTSYTARHSWATAARNHNIPISVISAGMGHTSEQTTRIYLASLENSIIDDANRGILEGLM